MSRTIGKYNLQHQPLSSFGFTSFGINGFVIGNEAFASASELTKTPLHELYRLHHSELAKGRGVDKHTIRAETRRGIPICRTFSPDDLNSELPKATMVKGRSSSSQTLGPILGAI